MRSIPTKKRLALREAMLNDVRQLPLKKLLAIVYSAHPEFSEATWDAYDDVRRQIRHENIKLA